MSGALFAGIILSTAIFIWWEGKQLNPLVDLKVLAKPLPDLLTIQTSQLMIVAGEAILMPDFFKYWGKDSMYLGVVNFGKLVLSLLGTLGG